MAEKTEINENFIVKNPNDKLEYIAKINMFINSIPKLRPSYTKNEINNVWWRRKFSYSNKTLLESIDGTLLKCTYFCKKSLENYNCYFRFFIVYSKKYNKIFLIRAHNSSYSIGVILDYCNAHYFHISTLKTLYKYLILETKSINSRVRQIKSTKDDLLSILTKKYHFNSNKGQLCKIHDFEFDFQSGIVKFLNYSICQPNNLKYSTKNLRLTEKNYEDVLKTMVEYSMHTDDFDNLIKPCIVERMNKEYEKLTEKNNLILSDFV